VDALFDDALWSEIGMLTEEGSETVWDRSPLFAFRGVFSAGAGDSRCADRFLDYCDKRLLGEHVPYAIESYPAAGMQQLSGESALFCLIVTEGLLAIEPEGLRHFSFLPQLPMGLDHIRLNRIWLCGASYDIAVERAGFRVTREGRVVAEGELGKRVVVDPGRR
jgi:hypothetical protein